MSNQPKPSQAAGDEPEEAEAEGPTVKAARLSVVRILVALIVIGVTVLGVNKVVVRAMQPKATGDTEWFAPYVDVTLPPYYDFQDPVANPSLDVVLSFVVGSTTSACTPSWGDHYDLDQAASTLDLDRRIVRLRERGGDVLVSFGGVANDELARTCTDPAKLAAAYESVISRYKLTAVDFDLEGQNLDDAAATTRRATAIAQVEADQRKAGKKLDVWLTLPMAPTGLRPDATAALSSMLQAKVNLAGVNVMAMEYGDSRPAHQSFVSASLAGLDAASRQLRSAYRHVGVTLTVPQSYAKLGITPMIGQNDTAGDVLDVNGAQQLFDGARHRGVTRISMWSLNRDTQCGANLDPRISDNHCSGVDQTALQFSAIFDQVPGRATPAAQAQADAAAVRVPGGRSPAFTDTRSGPYAEWRPRREYDTGTKAVWQGEVYVAKWWNVGDQPDAPVPHDWDTPWRLVGPVLEHDTHPAPPPTLAPHTYPTWSQTAEYLPGDRVLRNGVGYQAKWWTRGDDPTADVDNAWQSPWELITSTTD